MAWQVCRKQQKLQQKCMNLPPDVSLTLFTRCQTSTALCSDSSFLLVHDMSEAQEGWGEGGKLYCSSQFS